MVCLELQKKNLHNEKSETCFVTHALLPLHTRKSPQKKNNKFKHM